MAERFLPRAQEIYRHFKGGLYQVLTVAEHTETGEELVIYQAMHGNFKIYARPLEMFVSPVDRTKYPDAVQELRFQPQVQGAGRRTEEAAIGRAAADVQAFQGESVKTKEAQMMRRDSSTETGTALEEPGLDPLVLEFLDAHTYEQRLNVLAALHHRITNEMITTMALCCDIEVEGDDVEQRYEDLKQCLITKDRFEIKRLG